MWHNCGCEYYYKINSLTFCKLIFWGIITLTGMRSDRILLIIKTEIKSLHNIFICQLWHFYIDNFTKKCLHKLFLFSHNHWLYLVYNITDELFTNSVWRTAYIDVNMSSVRPQLSGVWRLGAHSSHNTWAHPTSSIISVSLYQWSF